MASPTSGAAMRAEILEGPDVLLELCRRAPRWRLPTRKLTNVVSFGSGSSYNAALLARHYFETSRGVSTRAVFAAEAFRHPVSYPRGTLALALSHSGRSTDVSHALSRARRQGLPTLAVTSIEGTPLEREADTVVVTGAGLEKAVPSTKGFTAMAAAVLALAAPEATRSIERAARALRRWLGDDSGLQGAIDALVSVRAAVFLGDGPLYPVARDGALKLLEVAYIPALAYLYEELRHGPLALVDSDVAVIALDPSTSRSVPIREAEAAAARLVRIGPGFPKLPVAVRPLIYAPALQLLAHGIGSALGRPIDRPRRLKKVVGLSN